MRFTSAFVSSLLAVSAVLAISPLPSNVGGIRVTKTDANFVIIAGTFVVPHIECGLGVAYVGVAIDDPSNCPGSFEVGVALKCDGDRPVYQAYSQYYPDLEDYHRNLTISEGSEIHIEISRSSTGTEFFVDNVSHFDNTGVLISGWGPDLCGDSVSWILRNNVILDDLQAIPKFSPVSLYRLEASDQAGKRYGPQPELWGEHADVEYLYIGYPNQPYWTMNTIGGPGSDGQSFTINLHV